MNVTITIKQVNEGTPYPLQDQKEALDSITDKICQGYTSGEVYLESHKGDEIRAWFEVKVED